MFAVYASKFMFLFTGNFFLVPWKMFSVGRALFEVPAIYDSVLVEISVIKYAATKAVHAASVKYFLIVQRSLFQISILLTTITLITNESDHTHAMTLRPRGHNCSLPSFQFLAARNSYKSFIV